MKLDFIYSRMSHQVDVFTTIIDKYSDNILGCILLETWWSGDDPETDEDDWRRLDVDELLEWSAAGKNTGILNVYLVWREPGKVLDLKALGLLQSVNINYSGGGGAAGEKLLQALSNNNINIYTDYGKSRNVAGYPFFDCPPSTTKAADR